MIQTRWSGREPFTPDPASNPGPDLDVSAAGHLGEVLVELKGFVHLVVRHAVAAQATLAGLVHLRKDHKLGHVGNRHQLPVQQVGKGHGLGGARAVGKPEPGF